MTYEEYKAEQSALAAAERLYMYMEDVSVMDYINDLPKESYNTPVGSLSTSAQLFEQQLLRMKYEEDHKG